MSRTAVIAAMEREVKPLISGKKIFGKLIFGKKPRGWRPRSISDGSRSFRAFEKDELLVVISGIGRGHAEAAARRAVAEWRPAQMISAGVAGALIRSLKAGSVVTPNVVVDAADGKEYRTSVEAGGVVGGGILVSAEEIAGGEAKRGLVERFHALVVDMEAAGVARAAADAGVAFRCVKAISDEADFVMPPLKKFVDEEGNFHSGRFALWTMARPWQWAKVAALGSNTAKAVNALCQWLEKNLSSRAAGGVVTLKTELQDREIGSSGDRVIGKA